MPLVANLPTIFQKHFRAQVCVPLADAGGWAAISESVTEIIFVRLYQDLSAVVHLSSSSTSPTHPHALSGADSPHSL